MNLSHFLRIQREEPGGSRHFVVHFTDPRFSLEIEPDAATGGEPGPGEIKRICVPNSWAGDYGKYATYITAAQEFFQRSFGEPAPKGETRRMGM